MTNEYRDITKLPDKDIIIFGGMGLEITVLKVLKLQPGSYKKMMSISNQLRYKRIFKWNQFCSYFEIGLLIDLIKQFFIEYKKELYDGSYPKKLVNGNSISTQIIAGDGSYIYIIPLEIDDVNNIVTAPTYKKPEYQSIPNSNIFLLLKEDNKIVMSSDYYVSVYNYSSKVFSYYLFIKTDNITRKVMFQNLNSDIVAIYANQGMFYSQKNNLGDYIARNSKKFQYPVYQQVDSLFKVKNTQYQILLKARDKYYLIDYISIVNVYPYEQGDQVQQIDNLQLKWELISQHLDTFYYQNKTWVLFGFPSKADLSFTVDGLFYYLNAENPSQFTILKSPYSEDNSVNSNYAISSFGVPNNLEIIGIDQIGTIHIWDLPTLQYKKNLQFSKCYNSVIGEVFHYKDIKKLVLVCNNFNAYSVDLQAKGPALDNEDFQFLKKLTSIPLSIYSSQELPIVAIGDKQSGFVYIYKYIEKTNQFDTFLTITPGVIQDVIQYIDMLADNTLWIQYENSFLFYKIQDCKNDSSICTQCTQNYYFDTKNTDDYNGIYGYGNQKEPYSTSDNFFTAIIKAQYYKLLIGGISNMEVTINISPQNPMRLSKELVNFDFTSIISLKFQSADINQLSQIQYKNQFKFENYNSITFQNILIIYEIDANIHLCGLSFKNIKSQIRVDNVSQLPLNRSSIYRCQQIEIDNSLISISNYIIIDEDLSNSDQVISTINSSYIEISNFQLINCTLGDKFSILTQETNINANIKTLLITNNTCIESPNPEATPMSLFTAGFFNVDDVLITGNQFCNKNFFQTITSLKHSDQLFNLSNITIFNNTFQLKTSFILFSALYSILIKPEHELSLTSIHFLNNRINYQNYDYLMTSSFIQSSKIAQITIRNVTLENHFDISAFNFEYVQKIYINKFKCINDDSYLAQIPDRKNKGCVDINEFNELEIDDIIVDKKKSYDTTLIALQNYIIQFAQINIVNGQFTNLLLQQTLTNEYALPIYLGSSFQISLNIIDCHFHNNTLKSVEFNLVFSTTALWIENYVGSVIIKDSSFFNCSSNTKYNFMYIQSQFLEFDNVQLQKSSFTTRDDSDQYFYQYYQVGGMMNLVVNQLIINNSSFSQSTAFKGSFIYLKSLGSNFQISMNNVSFSEGYAIADGSALYIDPAGASLIFICNECEFSNIYSLSSQSKLISIQQLNSKQESLDEVTFNGGLIQNIFGVQDNYFIEVYNTHLTFNNITQYQNEPININSAPYQKYLQIPNTQISTLANLYFSLVDIFDCQFTKLSIQNTNALFPLLINAYQTVIIINRSSIINCEFITSVIQLNNGKLSINNSKFSFIKQYQKQRLLLDIEEIYPIDNASSLIRVQQGDIFISNLSSFQNILCLNNCNGGAIQLLKGNINLDNIDLSNAQSNFGGAIFIGGITGVNSISNSIVNNCTSQYDGGAIYLQIYKTDMFQLKIQTTNFLSNKANDGKGGALYIFSDILNSSDQIILIEDTTIKGNRAKIGGAIDQKNISPLTKDLIMIDNIGEIFGNDQSSYPSQLKFIGSNNFFLNYQAKVENNKIEIYSFRSGDLLKYIQFQFMNDNNESIRPITQKELQNYNVYLKMSQETINKSNYDISGELVTQFNQNKNSFSFNDLNLVGTPGSSLILEFKSDQIYVLNTKTNIYEQNYSFQIQINFRKCISGEQINKYNNLIECQICPHGQYSYNVKQCQDCPKGATCSGGSSIVTNPGYWRRSNDSEIILNCNHLEENCVGGIQGDQICHEGHIGALCEECDIYGKYWGTSYSKSAKYSCTRCDQIKYNLWIVFLMALWTQVSMTLAIKGDIQTLKDKVAALTIQKNISTKYRNSIQLKRKRSSLSMISIKTSSQSQFQKQQYQDSNSIQDKSGIYIKMLTNYMQIVGSIATFNLSIPSGIFEFPQSIGQPLKQTMNSLDCALEEFDTNIPIIYLRLIFSIIIPIIYLIIFLLGITIFHKVSKETKFPWYILSTAIMFLIIYFQPDLVAQIIALLSCRKIGDTLYILSNVSFECYTNEHIEYVLILIIPLLLIWVFILPFILFMMLRKNKSKLDTIEIKLKYGFLYKEYKNYAFYWEFIKMAEKIAIILSLNFYSENIITKGILVFIVITLYGILSMVVQPYQEQDINLIDIQSTNVCAVTVLLGIFIYNNQFPYFVYSSLTLIILTNLWFIFNLLQKIIGSYMVKVQAISSSILIVLAKKFKCFNKCIKEDKPKKKMNVGIKKKLRELFQIYLDMNPQEKKRFIFNIVEYQIGILFQNVFNYQYLLQKKESTYHHIFIDEESNVQLNQNIIHEKQKEQQVNNEDILDKKDKEILANSKISSKKDIEQIIEEKQTQENNNEIQNLKEECDIKGGRYLNRQSTFEMISSLQTTPMIQLVQKTCESDGQEKYADEELIKLSFDLDKHFQNL